MERQTLLNIESVSKAYTGKAKALDGVSFSVERGQFVSVIGSSGAGKSTLLRCINRLIDPSSGAVEFDGRDVTKLGKRELRQVRRRVSMVFQHYNLVSRSTAIENVLQGRLVTNRAWREFSRSTPRKRKPVRSTSSISSVFSNSRIVAAISFQADRSSGSALRGRSCKIRCSFLPTSRLRASIQNRRVPSWSICDGRLTIWASPVW